MWFAVFPQMKTLENVNIKNNSDKNVFYVYNSCRRASYKNSITLSLRQPASR